MAKTFKEYLKEISDQQMKDMRDGNAYNGGGTVTTSNKKPKAKDPKSQERKDAAVAKMNAEDKDARKAQADKFAAIKKTADKKNESTNDEPEVSDEMRGQINQWIDKFSKYIGGNGDTLPEGYMQWALNSGIATDFYEQNEVEAFNKMKGYDADSEWSDEDHDDFTDNKSGASPITKACLKMLNKITGDDFIEDNAHIIDVVMNGNSNESTELDRIKELAGASIDETYDDDDEFYEAYGELWYNEDEIIDEAEYQGRKVKLGKPMQGDVKKFKVYVKDPKTGNVKKVNFGHGGSSVKGKAMSIKKNNPKTRKSV